MDATDTIEDAIDLRVLPELVDREKSIRKGWDAPHVADKYSPPRTAVITNECGEVANALDFSCLAVDAGHGVVALACVDEVLGVWVTMPRTTAVDHRPQYHFCQTVFRFCLVPRWLRLNLDTPFDPQATWAA